ncbi:hypothetical protein AJ80_02039 [Polytolypa hystricis UAMH7299]|uniref:Uncharacterized protein n=1 Tax=Polytolypa hystricis (strain UAMH7299) TaxID=1447883 RepID=A0A2B7YTL6_POLH7|nr:hypothetical protein AJ80_02039 [Polytolypa hystricis UAMH7299]
MSSASSTEDDWLANEDEWFSKDFIGMEVTFPEQQSKWTLDKMVSEAAWCLMVYVPGGNRVP